MASNRFGNIFAITTFGESHGECIGVVVDGCPAGVEISEDEVNTDLVKRRPSGAVSSTNRKEPDHAKIVSGVYMGRTTGAPITILIQNVDARSADYDELAKKFRPGHADFTYHKKYEHRDHRGGGRASGRETAARVAAGALAKKFVRQVSDVDIFARVTRIGDIKADDATPEELESYIAGIRAEKNSVGGMVELCIKNLPIGLGEPIFDKLDAWLAYAMMGIPAVKSFEIGDGINVAAAKGSENNDGIRSYGFLSNHAGGVLGGISNGEVINIRLGIKPTPSIGLPQESADIYGNDVTVTVGGRHDICIAPRIVPVAEAMAWLTIADFILRGESAKI